MQSRLVTITLKNGLVRRVSFLRWRHDRASFLAQDEQGQPVMVLLQHAYGDDCGNPLRFPAAIPLEISPVRLSPPACKGMAPDSNEQPRASGSQDLQEELHVEAKDIPHLRAALKTLKSKAKADSTREIQTAEQADWTSLFPMAAEMVRMGYNSALPSPEKVKETRQELIKKAQAQLEAIHDLTLQDVIDGKDDTCQRIREQIVVTRWAKETNVSVPEMDLVRSAFISRYEAFAAAREDYFVGHAGLSANLVILIIRFLDAPNEFLHGVKFIEYQTLTTQELNEFQATSGEDKLPHPAWHDTDVRFIIRVSRDGQRKEEIPLPNEYRALLLLFRKQDAKVLSFSNIQALIGPQIQLLDQQEQQGSMASPPTGKRVREMLESQVGKMLCRIGVLNVSKVGREKFLTISPPSPLP